jgi:hypothetical protein
MRRKPGWVLTACLLPFTLVTGCAYIGGHYPVNAPLEKFDPGYGYIAQNLGPVGHSEELLMILSFSGGGTWAGLYGVGPRQPKEFI